jgi:hypothetical protein
LPATQEAGSAGAVSSMAAPICLRLQVAHTEALTPFHQIARTCGQLLIFSSALTSGAANLRAVATMMRSAAGNRGQTTFLAPRGLEG